MVIRYAKINDCVHNPNPERRAEITADPLPEERQFVFRCPLLEAEPFQNDVMRLDPIKPDQHLKGH